MRHVRRAVLIAFIAALAAAWFLPRLLLAPDVAAWTSVTATLAVAAVGAFYGFARLMMWAFRHKRAADS